MSAMPGPYCLDRSLIRVSGPDAVGFLNNLLTQDVAKLAETGVQHAALLSPQGKLLADMLLWVDGDSILLEADPSRGGELLRKLAAYKLRAQVRIEDLAGQFHVLWSPEFFEGGRPDPRFPSGELGWREIRPLPQAQCDFPDGGGAYEAHRLSLGVPDIARDAAPDEVFALEALLEELHGVDFQKGCFVGQENVSRMKRRATTRKKFCPITFEGEAPAFGAPILAGDVEVGVVRGGMPGRAIALVRLDRAFEAAELLQVAHRPVRLDPPAWLMLPPSA